MQITPAQLRLVLSAFVAMLVLSALDQTILSTALPAIVFGESATCC